MRDCPRFAREAGGAEKHKATVTQGDAGRGADTPRVRRPIGRDGWDDYHEFFLVNFLKRLEIFAFV